jgi:hypothetical protein
MLHPAAGDHPGEAPAYGTGNVGKKMLYHFLSLSSLLLILFRSP